jgi:hypothetical protein
VSFDGTHLIATFDYFARSLDATLADGVLTGTYGATHPGARSGTPTSSPRRRWLKPVDPAAAPNAPDISGSWEIATKSPKGEAAWEFRADPPTGNVASDQDSDSAHRRRYRRLVGNVERHELHGGTLQRGRSGALYSVTPQPDGTLLIKSLLGSPHGLGLGDLIARRPADARKENLPGSDGSDAADNGQGSQRTLRIRLSRP